MIRTICRALALGLMPPLALCQTAFAAEQRSCAAEISIFEGGVQQPISLRAVVAAAESSARVRVTGSGEWSATRSRTVGGGGADTVVFRTATTTETMTIGTGGEMLWEIAYADRAAASNRVIAFVGQCGPWRIQ